MEFLKSITHYNPFLVNNYYLLSATALFIVAIILCALERYKWSVAALFVASVILNACTIQLDPFLNSWDERFHMLVAKNMSVYPFKPMLFVHPILPYDFKNWCGNHIWVHKQPLFLWQMALFIKLFGANEVVARLPSAIMVSLLGLVVFRVGKLLYNERVGVIAALFCVSNNFILGHVSGREGIDHNDLAFMFYITLSIWAWLEYERSNSKWWLFAMALFSGCAVLNKWVTGLAVYAGYGFYHLFLKRDFFKGPTLKALAYALIVTLVVAVPWQVYILLKYPIEAGFEFNYNSRHFFEVIEGHDGPPSFYIDSLPLLYSSMQFLIFAGIAAALWNWKKSKPGIAVLFIVLIYYLFFTISSTKMLSYVMHVAPLCFILMALAVDLVFTLLGKIKYVPVRVLLVLVLALAFFQNISVDKIVDSHWRNTYTYYGKYFQNRADNVEAYKKIGNTLPPNCVVAFCNVYENVDCMFYTNATAAYGELYPESIAQLKQAGMKVAVVRNGLPDFVLRDTSILILPYEYKRNEE